LKSDFASDFIAQSSSKQAGSGAASAEPATASVAAAALIEPPLPRPSRTQAFLKGAWTGYANQALVIFIGLWLTPFYLHHLGQRDYGLWLVGTQLFGYLTLLDLGVTGLLPRETAYVTGRIQREGTVTHQDLAELVARVFRIALWQMPVMALGAALLWRFNPNAWSQLRFPLAIALATLVLLFPTRTFHGLLIGLQDFGFLNLTGSLAYVLTAALTVFWVRQGWGLYALAAGWSAGQLLTTVMWIARAWTRYRYALPHRFPRLQWSVTRHYLSRSSWLTVAKIADVLLGGTDMLIIGKVLGPAAVVPYACTGKLLLVFSNQPLALATLAMPGLSEMRFAESRERMRQALTAITQGMLLTTGLLVTVVILVNRGFVGWWVGKDYYAGTALTVLLIVAVVLRHFSIGMAAAVFPLGYERRLALLTAADGVISVLAAILLTRQVGLIGIPLGNICGVCLIGLPGALVVLRRELKVSYIALLSPFAAWAIRLAVLLVLGWYLSRLLPLSRFGSLSAAGVACLAVYALTMWSIVSRPPVSQYTGPLLDSLGKLFSRRGALEQSSGG
jgi:O-antigen/teichoic acid export membrane protein